MKIMMFNGQASTQTLKVLSGGFDPTSGKMVLVVSGDGASAGTITIDVSEARDIARIITEQAPSVERVESCDEKNQSLLKKQAIHEATVRG